MKLLQVIGTLDPNYGGPVEVSRQINHALSAMGHRLEIATMDGVSAPWISGYPATVHPLGPSTRKYRFNRRLIPWLNAHAKDFDAILVDGIWQFQSFATWLVSRARSLHYFVFVHGALDPWFKSTYPFKHLKKCLYWPWAEYRVLRDARAVLFTSEDELLLARRSFRPYKAYEAIANLGIIDPKLDSNMVSEKFFQRYPSLRGRRIFLFLGRIHQKKGCDHLITAFARVASRDSSLHLVIAGPDQEGWQKYLVALSKKHEVSDRIAWTGMLTGDLKWGALHVAEVFVLPSHSENFGVAVVESLACGLPVLITHKVNTWREVVQDGAGFAEPDTLEGTVTLLERWLAVPKKEVQNMRERARDSFERRFNFTKSARTLINILETSLFDRKHEASTVDRKEKHN